MLFKTCVLSLLKFNLFYMSIVSGQNNCKIGGTNMMNFLGLHRLQPRTIKPKYMYTFIYLDGNKDSMLSLEHSVIKIWSKSWAAASFIPIVLTEKDAQHHSSYDLLLKRLSRTNIPRSKWGRYLKYLAMSLEEHGGWFSSYKVIPITGTPASTLEFSFSSRLPNDGIFTIHDDKFTDLISASKTEWERITTQLVDLNNERYLRNGDMLFLDMVLLQNQVKSEHLHIIEKSVIPWSEFFDSNLKSKVECAFLKDKIATKISEEVFIQISLRQEESNSEKYLEAILEIINECKNPKIYTFFEQAFTNYDVQQKLLKELDEWKKAWQSAGFQPIVLNLEDAKRHEQFKEFEETLNNAEYQMSPYDKMCYYRWLAVAAAVKRGGRNGIMCDIDTFPLQLTAKQYAFSEKISVEKLQGYCWATPCFVAGSGLAWNNMVSFMLGSLQKHKHEFWSDMLAFQNVANYFVEQVGYTNNHLNIHEMYIPKTDSFRASKNSTYYIVPQNPFDLKEFCHNTKNKLIVHFSHASCEMARFCHNNRGTILSKWLHSWREQCVIT